MTIDRTLKSRKILIAGASGLVGSGLLRRLRREEGVDLLAPPRSELDLLNKGSVVRYLSEMQPDTVILAAARVGGIEANRLHPVEFLVENLQIQNNVMLAARDAGVEHLMFLGSSCIYPRQCEQPMREEFFMTGPLEPTNESYAVAKIAGIRLAESLHQEAGMSIYLPMPSNVYGPGDHFDLSRSHVLSALVHRFETARLANSDAVTLWGTGRARREFIHVDDLADACVFILQSPPNLGIINVGTGVDISIFELAELVANLTGFEGDVLWDHSKPDGMPRKLLDTTRLSSLGWQPKIELSVGVHQVINEFRDHVGMNHP